MLVSTKSFSVSVRDRGRMSGGLLKRFRNLVQSLSHTVTKVVSLPIHVLLGGGFKLISLRASDESGASSRSGPPQPSFSSVRKGAAPCPPCSFSTSSLRVRG